MSWDAHNAHNVGTDTRSARVLQRASERESGMGTIKVARRLPLPAVGRRRGLRFGPRPRVPLLSAAPARRIVRNAGTGSHATTWQPITAAYRESAEGEARSAHIILAHSSSNAHALSMGVTSNATADQDAAAADRDAWGGVQYPKLAPTSTKRPPRAQHCSLRRLKYNVAVGSIARTASIARDTPNSI